MDENIYVKLCKIRVILAPSLGGCLDESTSVLRCCNLVDTERTFLSAEGSLSHSPEEQESPCLPLPWSSPPVTCRYTAMVSPKVPLRFTPHQYHPWSVFATGSRLRITVLLSVRQVTSGPWPGGVCLWSEAGMGVQPVLFHLHQYFW